MFLSFSVMQWEGIFECKQQSSINYGPITTTIPVVTALAKSTPLLTSMKSLPNLRGHVM